LKDQRDLVVVDLKDQRDLVVVDLTDQHDLVVVDLKDQRDLDVVDLKDQRDLDVVDLKDQHDLVVVDLKDQRDLDVVDLKDQLTSRCVFVMGTKDLCLLAQNRDEEIAKKENVRCIVKWLEYKSKAKDVIVQYSQIQLQMWER